MANEVPESSATALKRPTVSYSGLPELSKPFIVDQEHRSYKHQYSNIYFVRLVELRPVVEQQANERWTGVRGGFVPPAAIALAEHWYRQTASPTPDPEPATVAAVLHRWHRVSRHASQAECAGRYGSTREYACRTGVMVITDI